jgi:endonuclease III
LKIKDALYFRFSNLVVYLMPRETKLAKYQRALDVLAELRILYPDATTELAHSNPFELLISTILSAQATDVSVNAATPALYKKYPDAFALSKATLGEVTPYIKTIGLYRNKGKNIIATSQQLVERFNGEVPNDFEAITSLPGVGRKTANVVLSNAFGRPAIAVDTHVGRLARRLKFSKHDNPDKVEGDLQKLFPVEQWIFAHHALILHGRRVCDARKPKCEVCTLTTLCPSSLV